MPNPGDPQSAQQAAAPEAVRLQMIARDGSTRLAVINGRRVRTGDAIQLDGASVKVTAIHDDSIELDRDGHRQLVQLSPRAGLSVRCANPSSDRLGCRNDAPGAQP
jgi:hypothetical protein